VAFNPYIAVPLATWGISQVSKFALAALRGRLDFRYLYASGGMPSVHSAVVCALATTAFLVDGGQSHLFGFATVLAVIVMYDSFGVRRATGEQAIALNQLISSLGKDKLRVDQPQRPLREVLGHQPSEVVVGAFLGIVLGGLFNYGKLGPMTSFLQTAPTMTELYVYAGMFVLLILGGFAQAWYLRARYRKSVTIRRLTARIRTAMETIGWLGAATAVLQYEHASYMAWRLWALLVLVALIVWGVVIFSQSYRAVPTQLATEADKARKLKWLLPKRKAKR
jgi:acid phosphatase family membrane protein YuiD